MIFLNFLPQVKVEDLYNENIPFAVQHYSYRMPHVVDMSILVVLSKCFLNVPSRMSIHRVLCSRCTSSLNIKINQNYLS
jgi:hypothetical protein